MSKLNVETSIKFDVETLLKSHLAVQICSGRYAEYFVNF